MSKFTDTLTDSKLIDQLERTVEDLRDRTASTLAASDAPQYDNAITRRALENLADRVDALRTGISEDLDRTTDRMTSTIDGLRDDLAPSTSWWTRLTWMAVGAGIGSLAAMLMDDRSATDRRRELAQMTAERRDQFATVAGRKKDELTDRATEVASELADEARSSIEHQVDVQRGRIEGATTLVTGGRDPEDPKTLRQKIRSEVIGHVAGADDVIVVVHDQGQVELKGLVDSRTTVDQLLSEVRSVPGVIDVTESLQVQER